MGRGGGSEEGRGCNKAECISPGMRQQGQGAGRKEREGRESATNMSV